MYEYESKRVIETCKKLYDRRLILSHTGNVSVRLGDGNFLITPSRVRKYALAAEDLCVIDHEGGIISGIRPPSSEYRVHLTAYKNRPDVRAIVHCHSEFAIICSLATISFKYPILPETALTLGSIPTIPYAPPGSSELAAALKPFLADHNALILQRHGVVALGSDLDEAFDRLEEVEHAAKVAYHLSIKGRIPVLGRSQLMKMAEFAKAQGFPVPEMAMRLLHRLLAK